MKRGAGLEELFASLNETLCEALERRIFVCLAMGELMLDGRKLRVANGACPYPYHFSVVDGSVRELQVDAYPLGVRAGAEYSVVEMGLESGDYVVFCSDGIISRLRPHHWMFSEWVESLEIGSFAG